MSTDSAPSPEASSPQAPEAGDDSPKAEGDSSRTIGDTPEPGGDSMRAPRPLWRAVHLWGKQNAKWYYVTPPSAWAVAIYVVCFIPVPDVPQPDVAWFALDKVVHVFLFAVLALLIIRGWHREKMPPLGLHGFVWLLSTVFGIMIEIQQGVVPHRSFEGADIIADAFGAALGLVVWHLLMLRYGKRTRLYPGLLRPDLPKPARKDHPSQRRRPPKGTHEGTPARHD